MTNILPNPVQLNSLTAKKQLPSPTLIRAIIETTPYLPETSSFKLKRNSTLTQSVIIKSLSNMEGFTLGKTIGKGGIGKVKKASLLQKSETPFNDLDEEKRLVCKVIKLTAKSPEEMSVRKQKVQQEFNIINQLYPHSNNSLTFIKSQQINNNLLVEKAYMVIPYLNKLTLADHIPILFDNVTFFEVIIDIAAQLKKLHNQLNLAHCDIKPANIMLNDQNKPYLIDFGTAKAFNTPRPFILGTLPFSSADYYITSNSDIFQLGVTILWMAGINVMQRLPKDKNNFKAWKEMSNSEQWSNLRNYSHDITLFCEYLFLPHSIKISFKNLIERMLSDSPDQRPTLSEIIAKLEKFKSASLDYEKNTFIEIYTILDWLRDPTNIKNPNYKFHQILEEKITTLLKIDQIKQISLFDLKNLANESFKISNKHFNHFIIAVNKYLEEINNCKAEDPIDSQRFLKWLEDNKQNITEENLKFYTDLADNFTELQTKNASVSVSGLRDLLYKSIYIKNTIGRFIKYIKSNLPNHSITFDSINQADPANNCNSSMILTEEEVTLTAPTITTQDKGTFTITVMPAINNVTCEASIVNPSFKEKPKNLTLEINQELATTPIRGPSSTTINCSPKRSNNKYSPTKRNFSTFFHDKENTSPNAKKASSNKKPDSVLSTTKRKLFDEKAVRNLPSPLNC